MKITTELKKAIWSKVQEDRERWPSNAKHAVFLGISSATYSRLGGGYFDDTSDQKWMHIARQVEFVSEEGHEWVTAETPVFVTITDQLTACKEGSLTGIYCDRAGIGKTHTAKEFAVRNPNVAYIDCSVNKGKIRFIRALAQSFGVDSSGKLVDVIAELVYYIKTLPQPLIILDEAGDLEYTAFLEIKSLYNQLEDQCGFYLLGAEGLRAKIDRNIGNEKVGFTEIFDRMGGKYQRSSPEHDMRELTRFDRLQAELVIRANAILSKEQITAILERDPKLRRVKKEIIKMRKDKAA